MKVLVWEAGLRVEGKRFHVALIIPCKGDCKEELKKGYNIISKIEKKPIITWSDFFEGFVMATRFPRTEDDVKGFCEVVSGTYVEACELVGRDAGALELEQHSE